MKPFCYWLEITTSPTLESMLYKKHKFKVSLVHYFHHVRARAANRAPCSTGAAHITSVCVLDYRSESKLENVLLYEVAEGCCPILLNYLSN